MATTTATASVLAKGDHVRLAHHHPVPVRYQGTVAKVVSVLSGGRVGLVVKRRLSVLALRHNFVAKIPFDASRVFPCR